MNGRTIRVKVTPGDPRMGEPWYVSVWCTIASSVVYVIRLNEYAAKKRLGIIYAHATEEDYQAYRAKLRSEIEEYRKKTSR